MIKDNIKYIIVWSNGIVGTFETYYDYKKYIDKIDFDDPEIAELGYKLITIEDDEIIID